MGFYGESRKKAESIISKFGGPGSFVQKGNAGGFDEDGNALPAQPDVVINGTITPLLQYSNSEIDENRILQGDAYVFFHSSEPPRIAMQTTINGKTFTVVRIALSLDSIDGVNVLRKIQLRQ